MLRCSFAFAFILGLHKTYVFSAGCSTFENILFIVKDFDDQSHNLTVNGCVGESTLGDVKAKYIYIRNQKIPVVGEESVKNLPNLITLSFWGNKMDAVLPGAFQNLSTLKHLQLSYGNIKEIPRGVFDTLPSMEHLRIHNNEIDVVEDKAFANLVSLKKINADSNRLEYWNREWFTNTTNLEIMDFQENRIRTIPRRAFANLVKLKQIFFDYNEISVIHVDAFKGITQLDYLGLRYNRLKEIKEDIFPNNLKVRSFLIDANYLNFLSKDVLKKLSVKEINLDNNPWKCPCLDTISFWLYSTNGSKLPNHGCIGPHIPVCAYPKFFSQSCWETIDEELSERYMGYMRQLNPPLASPLCARLDSGSRYD